MKFSFYVGITKKIPERSETEKQKYLFQLDEATNETSYRFAGLVIKTNNALAKSKDASKALKNFFSLCPYLHKLASKIDSSDDISTIIGKVRDCNAWSFYNYELLEQIIDSFLSEDEGIVKELKDYKAHFDSYCRCRLYEIPDSIFQLKLPNVDPDSKVVMKIDTKFFNEENVLEKLLSGADVNEDEPTMTLEDIKRIQYKLSRMLNTDCLVFLDAKRGCIELSFGHFSETNPLSSMSMLQKIVLALLGVLKIHCGDVSHDLRSYVSLPPNLELHACKSSAWYICITIIMVQKA